MGAKSQRIAQGDRLQRDAAPRGVAHQRQEAPMNRFRRPPAVFLLLLPLFSLPLLVPAGEFPRTLEAFPGKTPIIDGRIAPGEWDDAVRFEGVKDWIPQFTTTKDPADLSLRGWVKHDGKRLYFAFEVTDDVLYGIDTERWLPQENPKAHELTRDGFPWFGDEMELLINAANKWVSNENSNGTGAAWQMVCNLTKSRKGGVGPKAGEKSCLLEGEPRKELSAWNQYRRWIDTGVMFAAARVTRKNKRGGMYVIEWAVNFNPCLEVEPGKFYSTAMGDRAMGLNIALGDIDEPERGIGDDGKPNFGRFHHEDWWAGKKNTRTNLRDFGTLWIRTTPVKK
jgi:SSS family solute:Na+ symporter